MYEHIIHILPANVEWAMGCWDEAMAVRYLAVYRDGTGEGRWYSGEGAGTLPTGLLSLLETLWGALVPGYGFVLDVAERRVAMHGLLSLESDLWVAQLASPRYWLQEATVVQAVIDGLVAYAEAPGAEGPSGCKACFCGYVWAQGLYAFIPCAQCSDAACLGAGLGGV